MSEPNMNTTSPDTSGAVRGETGDASPEPVAPSGARLQGSAARQHHRHRQVRVLATAGAVAAVIVAAVVTVTLHAAPAQPSQAAVPPPIAAVTSALARTSAENYTFSLYSSVQVEGKERVSDVVSGAFDPRRELGTELLITRSAGRIERAQVRFIGAYLYTSVSPGSGFSKAWDKSPRAAASGEMPPGDLYGFVSDQPVSPDELAVVLRSAGASVRDAGPISGPDWRGTMYRFTASLYGGREPVSGTAYVDQQGRVRRLVTVTMEEGKQATKGILLATDRDMAFGGFGASIRVIAPSPSQVKYTSGKPYWGFYF